MEFKNKCKKLSKIPLKPRFFYAIIPIRALGLATMPHTKKNAPWQQVITICQGAIIPIRSLGLGGISEF